MAITRYLVFEDGTEAKVVQDDGRYWITEAGHFKKSNRHFTVKRVKEADPAEEEAVKAAKKASAKKKAKSEPEAEE